MKADLFSSIEALESRIAPAKAFAIETGTNKLVSFDTLHPGTLLQDLTVTGLAAGELVTGIDIDQGNGTMFAFALKDDGPTRSGHCYTIDPATGLATQFSGFSFNSLPDTSVMGFEARNFTCYKTTVDDHLSYSYSGPGGSGSGSDNLDYAAGNETITALALSDIYGRDPVFYGYNYDTDELVTLNPTASFDRDVVPVGHVKVGGTNITANNQNMGFDIANSPVSPAQGWMSLYRTSNGTHFYAVDLATAALTDLGTIGYGDRSFTGLTVSLAAPAPSLTGNKATWTEADGDVVTLTISKGTLTAANFFMLEAGVGRFLGQLTLGSEFAGANVTITAKAGAQGDGQVAMGFINADNVDLGAVKVGGVISRIQAGDTSNPAPSVKSLTVYGIEPGLFSGLDSQLKDGAGSVLIKGNFSGDLTLGSGHTGTVTVAGDFIDGYFYGEKVGSYVIKGSVLGGTIGATTSGSVKIGGSVVGGTEDYSGRIYFPVSGVKTISIGGNLVGGPGAASGVINTAGVTTIKIGGSVFGSTGVNSGEIDSAGSLTSLTIGGGIFAADGAPTALAISAVTIGSITVKGTVAGTSHSPVHIIASGKSNPTTPAEATAIGKVTVGGDLAYAFIAAGLNRSLNAVTVDAAIGPVKIGGSMIASSITAGINIGTGMAGDSDDSLVGGNVGNQAILAKIASVTIGGQLRGAFADALDSFGIEAEALGVIKIGKVLLPLTAAKNDFAVGLTGDVRVREF